MWAHSGQYMTWVPYVTHMFDPTIHYVINVGSFRAINDMGPIWDPHVGPTNTYYGINVGLIRAFNDIVPIWDPHFRPDNTYGNNVG